MDAVYIQNFHKELKIIILQYPVKFKSLMTIEVCLLPSLTLCRGDTWQFTYVLHVYS